MGLYPTIELVTDQENRDYYNQFDSDEFAQLDSLYGAELARRVEEAEKGNKFKELWLSLKQKTRHSNPDIFSPGGSLSLPEPCLQPDRVAAAMARNPDLYVADEFHFGVHQEAAILNSLLLIRRGFCLPQRLPKQDFVCKLRKSGLQVATVSGNYVNEPKPGFRQISACRPGICTARSRHGLTC